jgi:regulator of PEP synthase PpsR (kinase-PPPase family)
MLMKLLARVALLFTSQFLVSGFTIPISHFGATQSKHLRVHNEDDIIMDIDESSAVFYTADDDRSCMPPTGVKVETKNIFAISDSTGVTAKSTIRKCLAQFGPCDERFQSDECDVQIRTFTFIRGEATMASVVKKAQEKKAFILFTIADPVLRAKTSRMCELSNIPAVDLLGPSLYSLSQFLQRDPIGIPMLVPPRVGLSDNYYRRIEAVEFTLKADDGQAPWLLSEADVIIVGVSRTGKTPLSVVISQTMGLKVANIPLVLEVPPPKELFESGIDPNRIFCLTIAPIELKRIRTTRLERRNVKKIEEKYSVDNDKINKSNYNDRAYLMNDLRNARELATKHNWTQIDVTGRAVEETASFVSEMMNERFEDQIFNI